MSDILTQVNVKTTVFSPTNTGNPAANAGQTEGQVTAAAAKPVEKTESVQEVARRAEETQASLDAAVDKLNQAASKLQHNLIFGVHRGSGRTTIDVTDRATNELIRRIPSETTLRLAEFLSELGDASVDLESLGLDLKV